MNPDLDLTLERVIRAPRAVVWNAWTDPSRFEKWWVPAPAVCRVDRLEVRPGGALVTRMSDDGEEFVPHLDASFFVVDELERIVFTNAIDSAWRTSIERCAGRPSAARRRRRRWARSGSHSRRPTKKRVPLMSTLLSQRDEWNHGPRSRASRGSLEGGAGSAHRPR